MNEFVTSAESRWGKRRREQCVLLTPTFCEPSRSDRDFIGKSKAIAI